MSFVEPLSRYVSSFPPHVLTDLFQGCVLDAVPYRPDVRVPITDEEELEQLSITGRTRVPFDDDYNRIAHAIQRDAGPRGTRANQNMNHNAVDIARIQAGIDVRTTVCNSTLPSAQVHLLICI